MRTLIRAGLIALAFCSSAVATPQESLPVPLRDWQDWVLHGEEFRRCPILANAIDPDEDLGTPHFRCAWPERLTLTVNAHGGSFTQRWQVFAESWVTLPGDSEHWPREVRLNGAPAPVVDRGGPSLLLARGDYTVTGRFEWSSRPESLPVSASSAIVDLTVEGQRIAQPERPDGAIWLGKRRSVEQAAAMEVQVYRLLRDEIPAYLFTSIRLNVAGDAREELLARVLPDGFVPLGLTGPLPARLERDGRLRIQVRPGSHTLLLAARGTGVAGTLTRPDASGGEWASEEIWSFASNDQLRIAAAEGADGIDPAQANVPPDWRAFPAFRMDKESKLSVVERSRGIANADDNRLSLMRKLWLDFDHDGFTAVDQIRGTMRRGWRLDMQAPYSLASARQGRDQLLVTQNPSGASGLELRRPNLDLTTLSRKSAGSSMPATGWEQRFERVVGTLHLPPGHRLIAALGADAAPESWWEKWGLWSVFGVALVVVFVYWTAGRIAALIAAVALLLTHQEAPGYLWMWGNLLAALAVARAATEDRFGMLARAWRTLSFVALGLALLPFLISQFRYALHPQLEPPQFATEYPEYTGDNSNNPYGLSALWVDGPSITDWLFPARGPAAAPQPPAMSEGVENLLGYDSEQPVPPPPEVEFDMPADAAAISRPNVPTMAMADPVEMDAEAALRDGALNAEQVVQRYAAGTVLQAGPGIPNWHYNSYAYFWTGPVESSDTVRFLYVGPFVMGLWRLLGAATLVILFLWLAALSFGGNSRPHHPSRATPADAAPAGEVSAAAAPANSTPTGATTGIVPVLLLTLIGGAVMPSQAQADEAPSSALLGELKTRLTATPGCAPTCASITAARVSIDGDRLEVVLQVSALANVAVPMPHASDRWQLAEVSVDARSALAIARENDTSLWVPLQAGAHTVRLVGQLAAAESMQLAFPEPPSVIDVRASGWSVSGLNEGRLVAGSLELVRERGGAALQASSEFPAYVRVERTFNLDLDWTLATDVWRIAPERAAVSLQIPLIAGESVLTPGVEVRKDEALVGLAAGETHTGWRSGLSRAEKLELAVPENAARIEVWNFVVNPQWNVVFEGFPPILPDNASAPMWVFRYAPRPGEKLALTVTRPIAVPGTTLAIDGVFQRVNVGNRSSSTELRARVRSTKGGRHVIRLPEDARVTSVVFDRKPQQLRPEKGELPLSLTPGEHEIVVRWEQPRGMSWRTHPAEVDLRSPASNVQFAVLLPESRWPLMAWGPGIGPAVLYWSELAIFIVIAWLLGRWSKSPLRFAEWLLLGLGLSTQSWLVFTFVATWLVVMRWREKWNPGPDMIFRYNAVQALLALFTLFVVTSLLFSGIRNGLLATPDMGILDESYGEGHMWWFTDQSAGVLDAPTVISAPMWLYRTLFFAWACGMAFALVRWLRWAFNAWTIGGIWRRE
jgi:hypothetical protein